LSLRRAALDFRLKARAWLVAKGYWSQRSYSQSGEDLIIKFLFNSIGVPQPSYIDLGAHHPSHLSNTKLLYAQGSRGINVEANPELIARFRRSRRKDINLNVGVVAEEHDGETVDLYVMDSSTMSTLSLEEARRLDAETSIKRAKTVRVPGRGLLSIIKEHRGGAFPDLLNVDIEGTDSLVVPALLATPLELRPKVICIETVTYSESGTATKRTDLIRAIVDAGYKVHADTSINTIFKRADLR
jgi:FkbM family methyltransferase